MEVSARKEQPFSASQGSARVLDPSKPGAPIILGKPLKGISTGKRKKIPLTEQEIKEAYVDKETEKVKKIKIKSSIREEESTYTYRPQVDWGKFNLKDLINKMILFSEKLNGLKLYHYQEAFQARIFESILLNDGEEITALFSRQSGKSETIAQSCSTLMVLLPVLAKVYPKQLKRFKQGIRIGLFAPTNEQAYTTHSRMDLRLSSEEAGIIMTDSDIGAKKNYSGGILEIKGPVMMSLSGKTSLEFYSYCKVQSAAKQTKIESKTYDLIIIEEAQDVDTLKVQKSIHPMGASTNATIIKVGTATSFVSDFYRAIQQNRRIRNSKIKNHYEYTYKVAQKYNPLYKAFIAKEKQRLGEESDAFKMAYNLDWLIEKGMALTPQMFEEYMRETSLGYEYRGDGQFIYVGGLDLAKENASTVFTVAKLIPETIISQEEINAGKEPSIKQVVNWLEMTGDNWEVQFDSILSFIHLFNIQLLAVDSTGVGDPIIDRLNFSLEGTGCIVCEVPFSLSSKHAMAVLFYEELRKRRIRIPSSSAVKKTRRYKNFLEQFFSCEKNYKGKYMQLEHSGEPGARDDYVDSLLLLLYGVSLQVMPKIKPAQNIFKQRQAKKCSTHSQRYDRAMAKWKKYANY
jgi:hypothetical protein